MQLYCMQAEQLTQMHTSSHMHAYIEHVDVVVNYLQYIIHRLGLQHMHKASTQYCYALLYMCGNNVQNGCKLTKLAAHTHSVAVEGRMNIHII